MVNVQGIQKKKKKESKDYEAKIFMVGDALIHWGVYNDAKQSDGSYNFTVTAKDLAGKTYSVNRTITIEREAPSLTNIKLISKVSRLLGCYNNCAC